MLSPESPFHVSYSVILFSEVSISFSEWPTAVAKWWVLSQMS